MTPSEKELSLLKDIEAKARLIVTIRGDDPDELLFDVPRWFSQIDPKIIGLYEDYFATLPFWSSVPKIDEGVFEEKR